MAMARSYFDGIVISYVLLILRMTCFHDMGPKGQNQTQHYISKKSARWQYQLDVIQLHLTVFSRVHLNAAPGAKSANYNCLVCCRDEHEKVMTDAQD